MIAKDIFTFIKDEENKYAQGIQINNAWNWSMREHIEDRSIYKNSQIRGNKNKGTINEVPVKNIMRPILNLKYRAEDIDVKDIVLYIDDPALYHLSFLVKKYHDDVYVLENDLDTFFDKVKESKIDLGGGLAKNIGIGKPEYVPLESIAFAHQKDMLNAPIGILHEYSPSDLKEFEKKGWGSKEHGATVTVDDLIRIYSNGKGDLPGPEIKVYEVHGVMPQSWLDDKITDSIEYTRQFQLVSFYKDDKGERQGLIIYRQKEPKNTFRLAKTEDIFNRSLGWGGIEELMEPQIWTNYCGIIKKDFLDSASKTIIATDDPTMSAKHPRGLKDMQNLEFLELQSGTTAKQIDTYPRNIALFNQDIDEWMAHAQRLGSATDPMLGESPTAGTPFRLQERVVMEGKGIHEYRRGQFAKWIEGIYRDGILPDIVNKITSGTTFLSELSLEELQYVADNVAARAGEEKKKQMVLAGKNPKQIEIDSFIEENKKEFLKGGNKRFIKILAGELKKFTLKVKVNVAGKQKNLLEMTDKLSNVFRTIAANPTILQIPTMAKLFNRIIENSNLEPMDFSGLTEQINKITQPKEQVNKQTQPMQPATAQ